MPEIVNANGTRRNLGKHMLRHCWNLVLSGAVQQDPDLGQLS
jgi:hypothetical protein